MAGGVSEVRTAVTLRLVVPRADVLLDASLRYDRDDPYAVHLSFPTSPGRDPIEWIFARSLVSDGLTVPAGDGDVRIWPSPDELTGPVYVELCSPSGRALFAVSRPVLADFVARCHVLVPAGSEADYLDLDAELDMLLHDDLS
jgi:Streptomyces sporulation and cell division protein, SsgA